MRYLCIIQARMSSQRLPGKVLMPAIDDKTMLQLMIERTSQSNLIDKIIIATSSEPDDDAIELECHKYGVECFRGNLNNVLERYFIVAKQYMPQNVIRLTADCPLIDHKVIDKIIKLHEKSKSDYTTNCTLNRTYPDGFDCEVFTYNMLADAYVNAMSTEDCEHVTPYIRRHAKYIEYLNYKTNETQIRITLDYIEDYNLIHTILNELYVINQAFTLEDIVDLCRKKPSLLLMNNHRNEYLHNIPYAKQDVNDIDIEAVTSTLKSSFLTQGPQIQVFEDCILRFTSAQYASAVNSATSALHIALLALDIQNGDIVWTTPNTFVASANCALYCNAHIDFVDISMSDFNMCIDALEQKLREAKKINKLPKVVIPVHFGGKSCDMKAIFALSQEYGFSVIEDASHAIGGAYKNNKIGSCEYSDITVLSFHPVKIITTGEGGMLLTNEHALAEKFTLLRTHGITRDKHLFTHEIPDDEIPELYFEQQMLGYNYRMTDLQAALGSSQIKRINDFITRRHEIAVKYTDYFTKTSHHNIHIQKQDDDRLSSYHLYVIMTDAKRELYQNLRYNGIYASCHYKPAYLHPYYQNLGFTKGYCANAEHYYERALSLPMYTKLTDEELTYIIQKIEQFFTL